MGTPRALGVEALVRHDRLTSVLLPCTSLLMDLRCAQESIAETEDYKNSNACAIRAKRTKTET